MKIMPSYGLRRYEPLRVNHMRLIYAGSDARSFEACFLQPFLSCTHHYALTGHVLDVSAKGDLATAVEQANLPADVRMSIAVIRAANDDSSAQESFRQLTQDCDPGSSPNQVMLDLPASDYPSLAARCRLLASKWHFGGPDSSRKIWPDETIENEMTLDHLRAQLTTWLYPRRISALFVAPSKQRYRFLEAWSLLPWAGFSFVQIADVLPSSIDKLWPWKESPDLLFCQLDSLKEICKYGVYSRTTCIVSNDDRQATVRMIQLGDDSLKRNYPILIGAWSQHTPDAVTQAWATKALERNTHSLPLQKYYHPRAEIQKQLQDVWRQGRSRVVGLIGLGGCGKSFLLQQFLRELQLTCVVNVTLSQREGLPTADALFVWDFYEQQFPDAFMWSLASYLNPDLQTASTEECLELIRTGLRKRQLRRMLLVLDGLETIQRQRKNNASQGEFRSNLVLQLLAEIASGEVAGVIVFLASRLEPADLVAKSGDGYLSILVNRLTTQQASQILRDCGGVGDDERLGKLAKRLNYHAITIYHLGRLMGDFYRGDPAAVDTLPSVLRTFQETGIQEIDEINRRFIQIFAGYEEHLGRPELAVLKRVATLDIPVSTHEFQQVFTESGDQLLAGDLTDTERESLQACFDDLQQRDLLTAYARPNGSIRYAVHPTLSHYFSQAYLADIEEGKTPAPPGPILVKESGSTRGAVQTRGFVRTRGAAVGARGTVNEFPTKSVVLDLLEKILFRTIRIGRGKEAWLFYQRRMGGDAHLRSMGQTERIERIKSWFSDEASSKE